jgi:hypothetical protein
MGNDSLIISLALGTLILAIGFGLWQWYKSGRAKVEHHHSALTDRRPELRDGRNMPGVKRD